MTPQQYPRCLRPLVLTLCLAGLAAPLPAAPPPGSFTPTFTEDFSGTTLNTAIWNTGMRWGGAINGEPQAYRPEPENVSVGGGYLTLTATVRYGRINKSGGYAANSTVLNIDGLNEDLPNGSYVRINDKKYKVLSSVGGTTPTQITIERAGSLPPGVGLVDAAPDNALVMKAFPIQSGSGFNTDAMSYRSGAIQTYKKWQQTYGYFEARVKMSGGKGTWPAFWLMPDRVTYGTDEWARSVVGNLTTYGDSDPSNDLIVPMGNEIDVFEHMATWKNPTTGLSKSHHGYFWGYQENVADSYGGFGISPNSVAPVPFYYSNPDTEFHDFGVYWGPGELRFYIDGVLTFRRTHDATIGVCPHYMIMNLAMSRDDWAGTLLTDEQIITTLPSSMQVDWIKAWSGTAQGQYVELEDVATATATDAVTVFTDNGAGGRASEKLASNADGDYIAYTIPVTQTGTQNIKLRYKTFSTRGRFQLSIDGVNQGPVVDQYLPGDGQYAEVDLGTKSFATAGNKEFRFTVVGKTTGSGGRDLTFDYLSIFPVAAPVQVTMDSESANGITKTGTWPTSTTTPGYLGANYLHDDNTSKGSKTVTYTPALTAAGTYQVHMRWTALSNRAGSVPVDILRADGTTATVTVNQTANNGIWMLLGTYNLSPSNAAVTIRTTGTSGYVIADGMRFTPQ